MAVDVMFEKVLCSLVEALNGRQVVHDDENDNNVL